MGAGDERASGVGDDELDDAGECRNAQTNTELFGNVQIDSDSTFSTREYKQRRRRLL